METVAEENPLSSATSRIVTAAERRFEGGSADVARRDFVFEPGGVGFGLEDSMIERA
jgi:hypothetical protein